MSSTEHEYRGEENTVANECDMREQIDWDTLSPEIFRFAQMLNGYNTSTCYEDVAQAAMINLLKSGRLEAVFYSDGSQGVVRYSRRATHNALVSESRKTINRNELPVDPLTQTTLKEDMSIHSFAISEDKMVYIINILKNANGTVFNQESIKALVLHYSYGLTYEEVADILNVKASTIGSRLHRIIREIRSNPEIMSSIKEVLTTSD